MVIAEGGPMSCDSFFLLTWYVDASWFGAVIVVSQVALVLAVLMLLAIWCVEWRKKRIW